MRLLCAITVFACAVSTTAPVFAHSDSDVPRMTVRLGDINFGSPAGAKTALRRIEQASAMVCGGEPDIRELHLHGLFIRCKGDSVQRAVASVNQPLLAQLVPSAHSAVGLLAAR